MNGLIYFWNVKEFNFYIMFIKYYNFFKYYNIDKFKNVSRQY